MSKYHGPPISHTRIDDGLKFRSRVTMADFSMIIESTPRPAGFKWCGAVSPYGTWFDHHWVMITDALLLGCVLCERKITMEQHQQDVCVAVIVSRIALRDLERMWMPPRAF